MYDQKQYRHETHDRHKTHDYHIHPALSGILIAIIKSATAQSIKSLQNLLLYKIVSEFQKHKILRIDVRKQIRIIRRFTVIILSDK